MWMEKREQDGENEIRKAEEQWKTGQVRPMDFTLSNLKVSKKILNSGVILFDLEFK